MADNCEHLVLVRRDQHVVIRQALREDRHLLLGFHHPESVCRAPPVSLYSISFTMRAPKRLAARRYASASSMSLGCDP